ncbi:MAG: sodium:solute symporter [Sumerlaeia bacterium]
MGDFQFSLTGLDYSIIAFYLLLTFLIGVLAQRVASKGADSFFLGGNKLPWWALGASGMASNVDIGGTALAVGLIYAMGVKGFFIEIRGGIVLIMAVLLAYMGKWNRRSGVMTRAEWMIFRFGNGTGGKFARVASALSEILFAIWVTAYFTKGLQAFVGPMHPWGNEISLLITAIIVIFVGIYSMAGGLTGVVWTDVFQGFLILIGVLYMTGLAIFSSPLPEVFSVSAPTEDGFITVQRTFESWSSMWPNQVEEFPGNYDVYNMFGYTLGILLIRTLIDGMSGSGGYMIQRYLAAKNEREAGLISFFWTFLLMFRWPLVVSVAVMGIQLSLKEGAVPIENPESVLAVVINQVLPSGMKGLMIAAFLAAFMSTLSSALNSCASYWVQDIYKPFFASAPNPKSEVFQGRLATMFFVFSGLAMSLLFASINEIWGWLTTALVGGLTIPLFLRWYWWRFNGEGFAVGTIIGNIAAILLLIFNKFELNPIPGFDMSKEINGFIFVSCISLVGCIGVAYWFNPTPDRVLDNYYRTTRPFGFWAASRSRLSPEERRSINRENVLEIVSMCLALPWQLVLFLFPMMLVLRAWNDAILLGVTLAILSVALYFTWYRNLSTEETTPKPALIES